MLALSVLVVLLACCHAFIQNRCALTSSHFTRARVDMSSSSTRDGNLVAISGLSSLGALETGYLSYLKSTGQGMADSLLCTSASSSCGDVLTGPYSVIPGLDIPLVNIAFVGYMSVLALSVLCSQQNKKGDNESNAVSSFTDVCSSTLFLTTSMATFSAYLMIVLNFVLHQSCVYCYLSAALSTTMAVLAWNEKIVPNATKAATVSVTSAGVTALSSVFLFYVTSVTTMPTSSARASTAPAAQAMAIMAERQGKGGVAPACKDMPPTTRTLEKALESKGPFNPPAIKSSSSKLALEVGKALKEVDAKMYGAYWCSHCNNQKQALGKEVYDNQLFTYIECDKEGANSQFSTCRANKNIPGYPTWEIKGQYYPGEKSVEELADLLKVPKI
jgi:uncharacterized membrane protein